MKNIKLIALAIFCFANFQVGFSQSDECKKNLMDVMKGYEKEVSSSDDMTKQKADALLEDYMATAYRKFPDCFPKDYQQRHQDHVEHAKEEDAKTVKIQQEIDEKEVVEIIKEKPAPVKDQTANLASVKDAGLAQTTEYQEIKKECTIILKAHLADMKKDMQVKKSQARTAPQRKAVLDGFTRLRNEVIHACVMDKMEDTKK